MEKMFCYQCQEAAKGIGCTINGVCGKKPEVSEKLDYLLWISKGISIWAELARAKGVQYSEVDHFIQDALFTSVTNTNFDKEIIFAKAEEGLELRAKVRESYLKTAKEVPQDLHIAAYFTPANPMEIDFKKLGVLSEENEDLRSLKELLTYGVKGMAAYSHHAFILGYEDKSIYAFMQKALAATCQKDISADELTALVLE